MMHLTPPYYAVIITQKLKDTGLEGYDEMAARMVELGTKWPGYLGRESVARADGHELTVIYYADAESLASWKADLEHLEAQRLGREQWYEYYEVQVARVERAYSFPS